MKTTEMMLPLPALWLLLSLLAQTASATPLTQYTCACPLSSTSSSTSTSASISRSMSTMTSVITSTVTSTVTVAALAVSPSKSTTSSRSSTSSTSSSAKASSVSSSSSNKSKSTTPTASSTSGSSSSAHSSSASISSSASKFAFSSSSSSKTASPSSSPSRISSSSSSLSSKSMSTSTSASTSKASSSSSSSSVKSTSSSSTVSKTASGSSSSKAPSTSSSASKTSTSASSSKLTATSTSVSTSHSATTASTTSKSTSTSSVPTIDSSGYHAFPTLSPNAVITASSYTRLTSLLPTALKNAISISSHSWELGTLANSLTEVYYPSLSPYGYDSSSIPSSRKRAVPEGWGNETHRDMQRAERRATASTPWPVLDVVTKALSSYSWSGAPSTYSWNTDTKLSDYLSSSSSPVNLPNTALISGDGALGDPCSLGAGAWIAAEFFQQSSVQSAYGNGRKGVDYAWAVGGQYSHLESGTRSSNGTLSQREGYFETWADQGYMIPPFLAYVGMATNSQSMLNDALSQWCLETSSMLNYDTMLFLHIPDWDQRPWATGNGWMLEGFTRVVASIYSAGQSGTFWSVIDPYESTVAGVFTAIFNQLNSQNLVPNYMLNTGDSTGDASGTAIITAAYYRFRTLAPWRVNSWMDSKASAMFDAVVGKVGSDGWLTQVVNPEWDNGWNVFSGQSPEAQSFLGLMWAARTAAGV